MVLTFEENNGIPFNEKQVEEYFNNLPEDRKITELAKFMLHIHKSTKVSISNVVNLEECKKRHEKIAEEKRIELENNVNRLHTFLRSIFYIVEKGGVVIIALYLVWEFIKGK